MVVGEWGSHMLLDIRNGHAAVNVCQRNSFSLVGVDGSLNQNTQFGIMQKCEMLIQKQASSQTGRQAACETEMGTDHHPRDTARFSIVTDREILRAPGRYRLHACKVNWIMPCFGTCLYLKEEPSSS